MQAVKNPDFLHSLHLFYIKIHTLKGCRNLPTAFSDVYIPGALTAPFPPPDELPGPPGLADGVFWGTDTL